MHRCFVSKFFLSIIFLFEKHIDLSRVLEFSVIISELMMNILTKRDLQNDDGFQNHGLKNQCQIS